METEIAKGTIGRETGDERARGLRALCLAGPTEDFDPGEGEVAHGPPRETNVSEVRRDCWP
jgi:hypothetical protein